MIKIALFGLGKMGKNHLRVLKKIPHTQICSIYDRAPIDAQGCENAEGIPITSDMDTALAQADAVVIATPTSTHFDIFKQCCEKVKYIFVEKPLCATLEQAENMLALAQLAGVQAQCGFIERYNPTVKHTRKITASKDILEHSFTRTSRQSARITDADVVLDLMIHDIDLALFFSGPVTKIEACGFYEHDMIAHANATLHHQSGRISKILASRMLEHKMRHIAITAKDAYITSDLLTHTVTQHIQSSGASPQSHAVQKHDALQCQLHAFKDAILQNDFSALSTLNSGVEAQRIAAQIVQKIAQKTV